MRKPICRLFAAAFLASMARAIAEPVRAAACDTAFTQIEINDCAHRQYLKADRKLNDLWPGVKRSADQFGAGEALLESQRKWIAFRDAACAAEAAPYAGGSIQPSVWSSCLERQTKRRIKDLKVFVN